MKYQARAVTDEFWIIEFAGRKAGVMFKNNEGYSIIITGEDSLDGISQEEVHEFVDILVPKVKIKPREMVTIDGFEIEYDESFNYEWQDTNGISVPIFTKTEKSKIYFAAGWYASHFPKTGWLTLFCPKHKTLSDFTFTGPFKNKHDAQFSIKQQTRGK